MTAGTGDVTTDPTGQEERTDRMKINKEVSRAYKGPMDKIPEMPEFPSNDKPQPQGAPTAEAPRCPYLQCAIDSFWHEYYTQELLKNRRILAAIRDDALANEIVQDTVLPKEAIFAYRAALLEHINAKENPNG